MGLSKSKTMLQIKADAKKRRASFLTQFIKFNGTITRFAERKKMTRARMSKILLKAKKEIKGDLKSCEIIE